MINNFDTTSLERAMIDIVKQSGATSVVYNNRPKSALKVDDFAVVLVSGLITDKGCYGSATIGIDLYARDVRNFKNTQKLKYMYERLIESMKPAYTFVGGDFSVSDFSSDFFGNSASYLIDKNPTILGDTSDDYGFTARLLNFKVIIKIS